MLLAGVSSLLFSATDCSVCDCMSTEVTSVVVTVSVDGFESPEPQPTISNKQLATSALLKLPLQISCVWFLKGVFAVAVMSRACSHGKFLFIVIFLLRPNALVAIHSAAVGKLTFN